MAAGFAISLKLIDLVTGPMAKVNQGIANLEKGVKRAAREGGLLEMRDSLTKIRREATAVGDQLAGVFTPLTGLGAAGSLAGMAIMAQRFALAGTEIGRTSDLLGIGARELQSWGGAARLAGGSAADATALISNMHRQLYQARAGLNPTVFRVSQQFGLNINKDETEFLLDAADRLQKLKPTERRAFAEKLGIDDAGLALLLKGRTEIERLLALARQHGQLTDDQVAKAKKLTESNVGLIQSVESMGLAIGEQIGGRLEPMTKRWTDWLDKARETPAAMKTIEIGVGALGIAAAAFAAGPLVALLARIVAINAALLTSPLGLLLAAGGGAYKLGGNALGAEAPPGLPGGDWTRWLDLGFIGQKLFGRRSAAQAPAGPAAPAGPSAPPFAGGPQGTWRGPPGSNIEAPNDLLNNFASMRAREGGWQRFPTAETGIGAIRSQLQRYASGRTTGTPLNTLRGIISTWAPPGGNDTEALIRRATGWMGVGENQPLDLANAETMRRLVTTMIANEHGGVLPKGAQQGVIDKALGGGAGISGAINPGSIGTLSAIDAERMRMARLPEAIRAGVATGRTDPAIGGGTTSERPEELTARRYGPAVPSAAAMFGGQFGGGRADALDTSHTLEVHFANAPPGMRSGLSAASGPAEVAVRTHYAMPEY